MKDDAKIQTKLQEYSIKINSLIEKLTRERNDLLKSISFSKASEEELKIWGDDFLTKMVEMLIIKW